MSSTAVRRVGRDGGSARGGWVLEHEPVTESVVIDVRRGMFRCVVAAVGQVGRAVMEDQRVGLLCE